MTIPAHLRSFWSAFVAAVPTADEARFYEACYFGDSQQLADDLAALVLQGIKRATAGAVWAYEAQGMRLPQPGDLSIVTSWSGQPLCVIETRSVDVLPFSQVTAAFAATEGEGDGSLRYWQQAHRQFFSRECAQAGRQFSEQLLVACECFDVVYQPPADAPLAGA